MDNKEFDCISPKNDPNSLAQEQTKKILSEAYTKEETKEAKEANPILENDNKATNYQLRTARNQNFKSEQVIDEDLSDMDDSLFDSSCKRYRRWGYER